MSHPSRSGDARGVGRRPGTGLLLLVLLLPAVLTAVFYFYEQGVVQRRTHVDTRSVQPLPANVLLQLERNDGTQRKYQYLSGWVVQTTGGGAWLKPSVLVVAPDGQATEFRANLRSRPDLTQLAVSAEQKNVAGFEVRLKKRYFPAGQSLKIVLAVTQQGRRILVDTGATVQGASS